MPGQKFSLQFLNDTIIYQICRIVLDADKALRYKVKYEDDVYEEELKQEDMLDMLESSIAGCVMLLGLFSKSLTMQQMFETIDSFRTAVS